MFLLDLVGAVLTLVTLGFLLLGGYLAALRLLKEDAAWDPLALAIASLLLTTAQAVGIALLLGALGRLRLPLALALQAGLTLALLWKFRTAPPPGGLDGPARAVFRRAWEILREQPVHAVLALLAAHAVGSEALRGLVRPPLSWDSLMYHLLLAGTWLRDGNLFPVFGNIPINYYGYVPANGSLWLWWWLAPSHSEFYVNLAALPHWVLLGLAAGGIARHLGARRHWPVAAFLLLLTPTVMRFAATQYVDILLGSVLLSAAFFALRWMRDPSWAATVLAGAGLGLAAGTKVLGLVYALALAAAVVPLALGQWRRRVPQLLAALAIATLLGGYFYARNVSLGAGPLAIQCEMTSSGPKNANVPTIPRKNSVLDLPEVMLGQGQLPEAFLGTVRPASLELGTGPQAFVLLFVVLALPFAIRRAAWREDLVVTSHVWLELAFWLAVPFAKDRHVFANIRYLIPALGLVLAAAAALAERRGLPRRWVEGLALVLAIQSLLQLHAEMPFTVRVGVALLDLVLVALALAPGLRAAAARHWKPLALGACALAVACAPFLTRFRIADRGRALATEFTTHQTTSRFVAAGWAWLDANGGDGNVAAMTEPNSYFIYPAMGPRLERDVRYVNINRADHAVAAAYPACQPRTDPDPQAWLENLGARRIRWLHLNRFPRFDFPLEDRWAQALPRFFALRYEDPTNRIYEFLPIAQAEAAR